MFSGDSRVHPCGRMTKKVVVQRLRDEASTGRETMAIRITESMKFNTLNTNLAAVQVKYSELLEKMASQKNINRISDDPSGVAIIMNYRQTKSSIDGYQRAIENSQAWITVTESKLMSANDLLVSAREISLSQGTGTASAETRKYASEQVTQIINELQSLANSQYADRYLFSGTKTGTQPFTEGGSTTARLGSPDGARDNTFEGTLAVTGDYAGDENRTYAVKILSRDWDELNDEYTYTWAVSSDGGRTWGDADTPATIGTADPLTIRLDDLGGIDLELAPLTQAADENDMFFVDAFAAGHYEGNAEALSVEIGAGVTFEYSITGDSVFSGGGPGAVDVFEVLNNLKEALENNNEEAIRNQLDGLNQASTQVNTAVARCGTRMNRLAIAGNNLTDLDFKITELMSNREDVDISALVTEFAMQEIVLKATYSMAAQVSNVTLLDFLR